MIRQRAQRAKRASYKTASLSPEIKNNALRLISRRLREKAQAIFKANKIDLKEAKKNNLNAALLKRLMFDESKLNEVIKGINQLVTLPDPIGKTISSTELDKDLILYKVSCPLGVLGIIFESRPDALVQIASLTLKTGNVVLLKGGREAKETNQVLANILCKASREAHIPKDWLTLLETREEVEEMLGLHEYIDLIIPRGSNRFVKYIMDNTKIMVLGHAEGLCHVYIDEDASIEKALRIAVDSKCQYAAVCNAMETLLVHEKKAKEFLPAIKKHYDEASVLLKGDEKTRKIISIAKATEKDWRTEYNDMILSIKVVSSLTEAIDHINTYGSHHTDSIVTENKNTAKTFIENVDSASVFVNASTRYADGFRFGLGAEVGISTNKIHARGPVGIDGLLSYKWILTGNGHIVADYTGSRAKKFTHRSLNKPFSL